MMEENVINGICCDVENCVYNNGSLLLHSA